MGPSQGFLLAHYSSVPLLCHPTSTPLQHLTVAMFPCHATPCSSLCPLYMFHAVAFHALLSMLPLVSISTYLQSPCMLLSVVTFWSLHWKLMPLQEYWQVDHFAGGIGNGEALANPFRGLVKEFEKPTLVFFQYVLHVNTVFLPFCNVKWSQQAVPLEEEVSPYQTWNLPHT